MGKLKSTVEVGTENVKNYVSNQTVIGKGLDVAATASEVVQDAIAVAGQSIVLALSKAWLGIGLLRPATTEINPLDLRGGSIFTRASYGREVDDIETINIDRFDTSKMWSVRFGDYFMPLSQTYTATAKKRINVSSLVDGIDIIQQTRKEAKTVNCSLKISVNENQKNLQIVDENETIQKLASFLNDLYESDAVFEVANETLNGTFGLEYVIMTGYKFTPRVGARTYLFEFDLTEVKYGDNVLTFDENQLQNETDFSLTPL